MGIMLISRPLCLEINESFLLCKKLSDKCENEYFIGGVRASLFFLSIHVSKSTKVFYFVKNFQINVKMNILKEASVPPYFF